MSGIIEWLSGKKTYIVVVVAAIYNLGIAFGWFTADNDRVVAVNSVLAAFGMGFLRAGVAKSG